MYSRNSVEVIGLYLGSRYFGRVFRELGSLNLSELKLSKCFLRVAKVLIAIS